MNKIIEFLKKNKEDIIKPIVVLLAICVVIPLALSVTNALTSNRIAELEVKKANETMAGLIKADKFELKATDSFEYNVALEDGSPIGYIFKTSAKGYGGEVSVMTAVNLDGKVKSVAVLDVSGETPGLGQNAGKESFYSKFSGKTAGIEVLRNGADSEKNQVDAVTGATITSKAVTAAVNDALDNFKAVENQIKQETEAAVSEE